MERSCSPKCQTGAARRPGIRTVAASFAVSCLAAVVLAACAPVDADRGAPAPTRTVIVPTPVSSVPQPPANAPATNGCRDESLQVGDDTYRLMNCADVGAGTLGAVLVRTDATRLGLLHRGDMLIANRQWLAWLDTQAAPGVLRGLWPLDRAGAFVGQTEPTIAQDAAKSYVLIQQGFLSRRAPVGYKGTHVEVWEAPEGSRGKRPVRYFSYRNDAGASDPVELDVAPGAARVAFRTTLVDAAKFATQFHGADGAEAELVWTLRYQVTPDTFRIGSEVAATADITVDGDIGGLLLIMNTGCAPVPDRKEKSRYASCTVDDMRKRTMHILETEGVGNPGGPVGQMGRMAVAGSQIELLPAGNERFAADEVRSVVKYGATPTWPWNLRTAPTGGVELTVVPSWELRGAPQPAVPAVAYRDYRATPAPYGGFRSLDLTWQPPRSTNGGGTSGPLRLGPNGAVLGFGLELRH